MMSQRPGESTGLTLSVPSNATSSKDKLIKREGSDEVSVHDRFDLLGDVNILLRDVKQHNNYSSVKPSFKDIVKSPSKNKKERTLQSTDELNQSISDAFKRSHHPFLKKITMDDLTSMMLNNDNQSDSFGMPFLPLPQDIMSCEGMVLIASLLCSCIRNVKLPFMRRGAVLLLKSCSLYIDDEDRLQRVLPYVVAMLSDPAAIVRCAALETLCDILPLVRDFPPSDAKIFPEYILPMLSTLPDDPEESVRICYAGNISKLALTAYGFLLHSVSLSEAGVLNEINTSNNSPAVSVEASLRQQNPNSVAQLAHLRKSISDVIQELVMGPKQTPNIRRALLQDIGNLCWFFGQRQSNDILLPILPAFLNDRDEQLRAEFYLKIVFVCFFVGQRSVEEYLLPYIEQALTDITEAVVVNALDCLAILCKNGFLRKRTLLEMIDRAISLLCYPSQWVRKAAVAFTAATSDSLGAVDSYVFLVPLIRPFLRRQPASLASDKALFSSLKPPVSREIYHQVLENARSSDMLERQRKIWYNTSSQSKQWETVMGTKELDALKSWSERPHVLQENQVTQPPELTRCEDLKSTNCENTNAKIKSKGILPEHSSSTADSQDRLASDKLQLSGFLSPQVSFYNSFHDKSAEGIPLYYFKVDNKRALPTAASAASDYLSPSNPSGLGSSSVPWMDTVSKSFSLPNSTPSSKLASASISNNGTTQLRRVVHEVEDTESDQTIDINNKFQDMGVSTASKVSTLATVDNSTSPEASEVSPSSRTSTIPDSGWRPRGVLVAHLQEHRSAVNDVAVSMDQSFFVSASDDSTVKVWDSKKLEKDISFRSKVTYSLEGSRALCVTVLPNSSQVVVGASDGTLHMFTIDYVSRGLGNVVEKYSGIADMKKNSVKEGAVVSLLNHSPDGDASKMILYSTQNSGVHLWDPRTTSNAWTSRVCPEEGYVSSLIADPCGNWFVSGSSRGTLTLWDLRFRIPVNSWQYSVTCPVEKMCLFIPSPSTSFSTTTRPLVYVAAGFNEVSLWNAENGSCHQVYFVLLLAFQHCLIA